MKKTCLYWSPPPPPWLPYNIHFNRSHNLDLTSHSLHSSFHFLIVVYHLLQWYFPFFHSIVPSIPSFPSLPPPSLSLSRMLFFLQSLLQMERRVYNKWVNWWFPSSLVSFPFSSFFSVSLLTWGGGVFHPLLPLVFSCIVIHKCLHVPMSLSFIYNLIIFIPSSFVLSSSSSSFDVSTFSISQETNCFSCASSSYLHRWDEASLSNISSSYLHHLYRRDLKKSICSVASSLFSA